MPGGDGTGPAGMGPMTGRAAGYCAGYSVPGSVNFMPGGGFWSWGRGGGRGWRNRFYATGPAGWRAATGRAAFGVGGAYAAPFVWPFAPAATSTEQELDLLWRQTEYLTNTLEGIKNRIEEFETQPQEQ